MPYKRQYHDPFIDHGGGVVLPPGVQPPGPPAEEPEMVPARALMIERPGIYLHVEDVAAALRQMALERPEWSEPLELAAAGFAQPQVVE